ncbi:putative leader peptide [Actinomadura sp. SCN-SB]|uniref:putative leader peptide n=1 Tax=Actinomadura sp. SCN-SB TaxID=3373092 RepID=UPI0037531649
MAGARGRRKGAFHVLSIVRGVYFAPPGSPGFPHRPPRLVRRLHVDLCRMASCLCP